MAISRSTPIDFAKIANEMRPLVGLWYNADIQIVDSNLREQTWDEFTNTYGDNTQSVVYSGKARIQPIRGESLVDLDIAQGSVRSLRIQVPYETDLGLIRKGLRVIVIDGGEDVALQDAMIIVRGAINSSYGWNRTIECDINLKDIMDDGGV